MKFALTDGHTVVFFYRGQDGRNRAFPEENERLIRLKGTEVSKAFLNKILGMEENVLDYIAVEVTNSKHGDFLKTFATAWQLATPDNKILLTNVWDALIKKFDLDTEFLGTVLSLENPKLRGHK